MEEQPNETGRWLKYRSQARAAEAVRGRPSSEPGGAEPHGPVVQLPEREQALRVLAERVSDCVQRFDHDLRHLYVNPAAEQLIGVPRGQLIGKTFRKLGLSEQMALKWRASLGRVFEMGKETVLESKLSTPSREIMLESRFVPEFALDGSVDSVLVISRDITPSKQMEAALQLERDRLASIVDTIPDSVCIISPAHEVEYTNPVIEREFGPVQGRRCFEYFHGRTESCPWCKNDAVFAGKAVHWNFSAGDNGRVFDVFDAPIKNRDGSLSKFEILRDITELKQTEAALHFSEERYRTIFNKVNDAIMLVGVTDDGTYGTFEEVNDVACRMFGYTREELLSKSPEDIVAEEAQGDIPATLKKLFDERYLVFERIVVAKDGSRRPLEFNAHFLHYHGRPTVLAVARDISKRKQAEQELREAESKFRQLSREFQVLLEAIDDTLILLSPELKVLWTNRDYPCGSNLDRSELAGRFCYQLFTNRVSPCEECRALACFRSGEPQSWIMVRDGRFIDKRAFPIEEEGRTQSIFLVLRDVTEKMNLQQETIQASQLACLGELAASVAHEINNPINGIINYAQILVNKSSPERREHELGSRIIKESDRIATIARSLLSFARQDGGGRRPTRVDELLNDALTLIHAPLRKEGIRLRFEVPQDLPKLLVNPQQILQVILNIVSNARHALNMKYQAPNEQKILLVAAEERSIGGQAFVRLVFQDHGTGIPAHLVERVMDPFFTTKPAGKGTGLGMSISQRIVAEHGGRINIESIEEEFTRVSVELPTGG